MKQILEETKAPARFIVTKKPTLTERTDGSSAYVVEGVFGKIDMKNENNRCYPGSVFERNLKKDSNFMRRLESRSVLGELEHPESGNTHLERVSHLLTAVWTERIEGAKAKELNIPEGQYVMGRMELLNTPRGNILKALYEANVNVGVSSRGRGDVRQVEGVDIVQDDYELDTFDAVYMPSVVEARPKRLREDANDLGSALPSAAASAGKETPAPEGVPASNAQPSDWKKESEGIIRKLEAAVSSAESDIASLIELIQPAVNLIDQLSALDDQEAMKVKSQATTLLRVLTSRIADVEAGKVKAKKEKETKASEKGSGKPKEESVMTEADFAALAGAVHDDRIKAGNKAQLYKGDVEIELKKAGQEVTDSNVNALANQLKAKGLQVDATKYESLGEATQEKVKKFISGQIVSIKPKDLNVSCERIKTWLEKQESDVLARVGSCGSGGMVIQLIEPEVAGHDIFVEYQKAKTPVTESKENSMDAKQMIETLVKENTELKQKIKEAKPEGVPVVRYEAAKKMIEGLVKRVKTSEALRAKAESKVKASVVLMHKLVAERKAKAEKKDEKADKIDKKEESVVAESVVTKESQERRARLHAAGKQAEAPVVETKKDNSLNIMSRTVARLNG